MSWALVAGASEGLGESWANGLAAQGHSLLLIARRKELLEAVAAKLPGTEAVTASVDLSSAGMRGQVQELIATRPIDVLVCNAASSPIGPLSTHAVTQSLTALDVNCRSVLELVHLVLPGMLERKRGTIILMSSLSAFQGVAYTAVYAATKAFNLSLAEALWAELRGTGVEVLACCAGATRTPSYLKAMPQGAPGELEPDAVVREALAAVGKGPTVITGRFNRLASFFMRRVLPRRAAVNLMASQTKRLQP